MKSVVVFGVVATLLASHSEAKDVLVFGMRKNLPMTAGEKVYHDYYLNGGAVDGLREGMVLTVLRRTSLYDPYQNRSPGDLMVPVARLQVVHVQNDLSVARLHSEVSAEERPVLDDNFVMAGDRIDLVSAEENTKKYKRAAEPKPASVAAPATAPAPAAEPEPAPAAEAPAPEAQPL